MSNEENSGSKSANSKLKYDRTLPKCGRCNVHGVHVGLKGHKRYCRYQNCNCSKCYIFLKQQKLLAEKIAMKRANDLKEKKKILPQELEAPSPLCFADYKRLIHEDPMSFMTFQQTSCCYISPPRFVRAPDEGQSFGIRSPQYPFQNLPVWPPNFLPMLTTSTSSFLESSLKPPTEPSPEPFTDPSTEPSTESSTELSTDSSTDPSTEYSTY